MARTGVAGGWARSPCGGGTSRSARGPKALGRIRGLTPGRALAVKYPSSAYPSGPRVTQRFRLKGRVSSASPSALLPVLGAYVPPLSVVKDGDDFLVEGVIEGTDAKAVNRALLSALRRIEKRTRLRAEWTSDRGTTFRFFDYVLKQTSDK